VRLRALAVVAALAGCNGTAERPSTTGAHGPGAAIHEAPPAKTIDPGPPPTRDCTLLAPAIERITAAELDEIARTRPADVAPLAAAEVTATAKTLVEVLPALCEQDAWSGAYTACVAEAKHRDEARACDVHLTPDQVAHLEAGVKAGISAASALGIPECDAWLAMVMRLSTCDKFPAESRTAMQQAVQQAMESWRETATTPEIRASIGRSCQQGVDAMAQTMTALGCAGS